MTVRAVHSLKCTTNYFGALWERRKTAELRLNDRKFKVGDELIIYWHDDEVRLCIYEGCMIKCTISEVTTYPKALQPGWVMLSLTDLVNYCKGAS
jgi:hypothetical protein